MLLLLVVNGRIEARFQKFCVDLNNLVMACGPLPRYLYHCWLQCILMENTLDLYLKRWYKE